jgi:hypothetical protein
MDTLRRLWRGDVGLARTYWLWGFVISGIGGGVLGGVAGVAAVATGDHLIFLIVFILAIIWGIFMSVAVWRSAGNYKGKQRWANLARLAVVLGSIYNIYYDYNAMSNNFLLQ